MNAGINTVKLAAKRGVSVAIRAGAKTMFKLTKHFFKSMKAFYVKVGQKSLPRANSVTAMDLTLDLSPFGCIEGVPIAGKVCLSDNPLQDIENWKSLTRMLTDYGSRKVTNLKNKLINPEECIQTLKQRLDANMDV